MDLPVEAYCEHLLSPVTALAFARDLLFAGEGPYLRIFTVPTTGDTRNETIHAPESHNLATWRIFDAQAIHGIVVAHDSDHVVTLIIYGGRYVRAALISGGRPTGRDIHLGNVQECSDWILDLAVRPLLVESESGILEAVAVTAHNALIGLSLSTWDLSKISGADGGDIALGPLTGATKCMLYAASVHWPTPRLALVVSGTAFGELIVWTCQIEGLSARGVDKLQVHYAFPAHDGSVFGLDTHISSRQRNGKARYAMVVSCSDDRTIRLWDVSAALSSEDVIPASTNTRVESDISELVAGYHTQATEVLIKPAPSCFSKIWAHSSRIWHVKFASTTETCSDARSVTMFSFGEDATVQAWSLQLSEQDCSKSASRCQNIDAFSGHSGKNIWSYAIAEDPSGHFVVATGGADGSIVTGKVPKHDHIHFDKGVASWTLEDVLQNLESSIITRGNHQSLAPPAQAKDGFKAYGFISDTTILVTTQRGMVIRATLRENTTSAGTSKTNASLQNDQGFQNGHAYAKRHQTVIGAELVCHNQSLNSYSVLVGLPSLKIAFIGGADGQILIYDDQFQTLDDWTSLDNKIAGLFVSQQSDLPGSAHYLLATELNNRGATIFTLRTLASNYKSAQTPFTRLLLPEGFVVTSMAYSRIPMPLILLGSRDGRILLHPINKSVGHESRIDASGRVMMTESDLVGRHLDAVTSMLIQEFPLHGSCHVLTTARDSTYAIFEIAQAPSGFSTVKIHDLTLPFGPNIERAYRRKPSGALTFHGFNSKDFLEYSESNFTETMRVECGGAHRVWAYQPANPPEESGGRLVWTKAGKLHSFSHSRPKHEIVKRGGHGREIKACARRPTKSLSNGCKEIFATGAEDTDIRLFQYTNETSFRCISVLKKHNTGIQHLQWSDDGQYLFSCGGCEELFVWKIRDDDDHGRLVEVQVVCEATLPPASELPDLRIMSISIQQHRQAAASQDNDQIRFSIFMAFSDSTMRSYSYMPSVAAFTLVSTGVYKTCSLTQSLFLTSESPLALTGATDGTISIWHTQGDSESISCLHTTRVHQNAIKDMTCVNTQPPGASKTLEHLVFSVGDDNAVAVTRVTISNEEAYTVNTASLIIPRAHVAAATAATLISSRQTGERFIARLATSGNDQRLKVWEFVCDLTKPGIDGIEVRKVCNNAVAIADVSCMASFTDAPSMDSSKQFGSDIIICGVGMQVFKIQ